MSNRNNEQLPTWFGRTAACQASENVMPGESPAAYYDLWQAWLHEYQPESQADLQLVSAVVNSAWRLQRTEKALLVIERELHREHSNVVDWPDAETRRLLVFQRAHKEAETAFHRNLKLVVHMKNQENRDIDRADRKEREWAKANPHTAAALIQWRAEREIRRLETQDTIQKTNDIARLDQWVEVRIVNGETVTERYPSNEALLERRAKMEPEPTWVYRHIRVPNGGGSLQQLTVEDWLAIVAEEREQPTDACGCPVCTRHREILEQNQNNDA